MIRKKPTIQLMRAIRRAFQGSFLTLRMTTMGWSRYQTGFIKSGKRPEFRAKFGSTAGQCLRVSNSRVLDQLGMDTRLDIGKATRWSSSPSDLMIEHGSI